MARHAPEIGSVQLVTFSCHRRMKLLGNPDIRDAFCARLASVRDSGVIELHGYVVMPEHAHLLLTLRAPLARILQSIKQPHSWRVLARWRALEAPVLKKLSDRSGRTRYWMKGGGHWKAIETLSGARAAVTYLHENPVRRGLVARAGDWRWSSALWYETGEGFVAMDKWPL